MSVLFLHDRIIDYVEARRRANSGRGGLVITVPIGIRRVQLITDMVLRARVGYNPRSRCIVAYDTPSFRDRMHEHIAARYQHKADPGSFTSEPPPICKLVLTGEMGEFRAPYDFVVAAYLHNWRIVSNTQSQAALRRFSDNGFVVLLLNGPRSRPEALLPEFGPELNVPKALLHN
jgi:hypothetical protein